MAPEVADAAEIKLEYCNGTDDIVNIWKQKRFGCFENPSVYAFRECYLQGTCEKFFASCFEAADATQSVYTNFNFVSEKILNQRLGVEMLKFQH